MNFHRLATLVVLIIVALAALAVSATLSTPVVRTPQPLTEWAMPVVASGTPTAAATGGWFSTLYPTETPTGVPSPTATFEVH